MESRGKAKTVMKHIEFNQKVIIGGVLNGMNTERDAPRGLKRISAC
jgi:hypothetical protein